MFLIDAPTVMHEAPSTFVAGLARLARTFGTPSIVVFDRPPLPHVPLVAGVRVVLTHGGATVASRIYAMSIVLKRNQSFAVVTDDDRLTQRLRAIGVSVMMGRRLREALAATPPPRPTSSAFASLAGAAADIR